MKFLKNVVYSIISILPNIRSFHPVTQSDIKEYENQRDQNILWADEV